MRIDADWDLCNYHLYNPDASLAGCQATDIAAAMLRSLHNLLLDVPFSCW